MLKIVANRYMSVCSKQMHALSPLFQMPFVLPWETKGNMKHFELFLSPVPRCSDLGFPSLMVKAEFPYLSPTPSGLLLLLLLSRFSCVRLCVTPIDGSPPVSPVPGILQARTLEWVAISFSNA